MSRLYIVDGNAIGHAAHRGTKLTTGELETQAIYGVVRAIRKLAEDPTGHIVVLWDGRAEWRYRIFPNYKAGRTRTPKQQEELASYKAQTPIIEEALRHLQVQQVRCPSLEADDIAGLLALHSISNARPTILVTGDKDWLQLVDANVTWFDPIRDRSVSLDNFEEFTGYPDVDQFVQAKAMMGDRSDTIPGVGGMGEVNAKKFLRQFGSVENFIRLCDNGLVDIDSLPKAWRGMLTMEKREAFHRNMKLMRLDHITEDIKDGWEFRIVQKGEFNEEKFRELCEDMAFQSILREFDDFIRPFKAKVQHD